VPAAVADAPVAAPYPPGPRSRPRTTIRFARDPYATFSDSAQRYGDPFTLPLLGTKVVITGQAELVRAMYALSPGQVGGLLGHLIGEILGPGSVLVRHGDAHTRDRKLLMPVFHRERVAAHASVMADVTRSEMARHAPGDRVTGYEIGRAVALGVILRAVFGVEDEQRLERFREAVLNFVEAGSPALIFLPALRRDFGGHGPWAKAQRRMAELDALFYEQIGLRRQSGEGDDILGLLIDARYEDGRALTDGELRDQLMSFVLAGHETMAVTFAWALYWILSSPSIRARLEEELAGRGEDVGDLPYLETVCRETLRIYPIQPVVMRHLLEPTEFAGYDLPAGAFVGAAATLVHMNPELYPHPERFDPDRFADGGRPLGEFFPFGGGARRCLGAAFAMQELKTVLAVLVGEYRLQLVDRATPKPARRSTVTGPEGDVPLIYDGVRT
jgi:cytochrome P450